MTTPPLTYTLTEQQRLLVCEALAMLAASRRSRSDARSRTRRDAFSGIRYRSFADMENDQLIELNALRKVFGTTSHSRE